MNNSITGLAVALVNKQDINELFRKQLETTINTLLETELSEHLCYEKHKR